VKHCPTCTCEEKRVYKTRAERQAAYRKRKRAKVE
jgi:transcriptional regulator NrdR family protein